MMTNTVGEERDERIGRGGDKAVFQSKDELLEESVPVRPSDEESVEDSGFPALSTNRPIFLIGSPADRAFLIFPFRDGGQASRASECALSFTA